MSISFYKILISIIIRKTLFHLDDNLKKSYNNGFGNIMWEGLKLYMKNEIKI